MILSWVLFSEYGSSGRKIIGPGVRRWGCVGDLVDGPWCGSAAGLAHEITQHVDSDDMNLIKLDIHTHTQRKNATICHIDHHKVTQTMEAISAIEKFKDQITTHWINRLVNCVMSVIQIYSQTKQIATTDLSLMWSVVLGSQRCHMSKQGHAP